VANVGKDAIYTRLFRERFSITIHLHIVNIRICVFAAFGGMRILSDSGL